MKITNEDKLHLHLQKYLDVSKVDKGNMLINSTDGYPIVVWCNYSKLLFWPRHVLRTRLYYGLENDQLPGWHSKVKEFNRTFSDWNIKFVANAIDCSISFWGQKFPNKSQIEAVIHELGSVAGELNLNQTTYQEADGLGDELDRIYLEDPGR